MLSIMIILFLMWGFYVGYSRGIALQLFYSAGLIVAMVIASLNYETLAAKISMWIPFINATETSKLRFYNNDIIFQLDKVFYSGLAYFIIFTLVYLIFRIAGIFLGFISGKKLSKSKNQQIIAGVLGFIGVYFGLEMLLTIASVIPINSLQDTLYSSGLVRFMVLKTPIFAHYLMQTWFEQVIHKNPSI